MIEFIVTIVSCAMALFYYWSWYTLQKDYDKLTEEYDAFHAAILMVAAGRATIEVRGEAIIIRGE